MCTTDASGLDGADMQRLAGGHDAALNDLMARHARPIFQFLCRMLGSEDDANDLAQETFVRVYQHRASFKPGARFTTWLYTIAGNLARNHHRWRSRHPQVSLDAPSGASESSLGEVLPSPQASPGESVEAAERAAAVRAAVDSLPEDMRASVILCEWEDMSMAEAAAVLQTTPKAIDSYLYRARKILRQRLRAWC
jgi:RNA polymerase sigma-70 factor (ECF subfamily)